MRKNGPNAVFSCRCCVHVDCLGVYPYSILSEGNITYNPERSSTGGYMSDLALYSLSEEHKIIRDASRDFAQNEIVPIAAEFYDFFFNDTATTEKMGGMGFM